MLVELCLVREVGIVVFFGIGEIFLWFLVIGKGVWWMIIIIGG